VACDGVQTLISYALRPDDLRAERRRAASEIGLFKLERESPSVMVGNRRVKAWRVAGTPEYLEHARLVALLAEAFSNYPTCG